MQNMKTLKIKKLQKEAMLPTRATEGSAGYDLYACINEDIIIEPNETKKIGTGIAIALESNEVAAFVFARSGLAVKNSIAPANCVGVVDSDYRGEVIVGLKNSSSVPFTIHPNDRIAQLVIMPVICPELVECDDLDETERGEGGFGSTGKGIAN